MRVVFGYEFNFKMSFTCLISSWRFFVVEQRALANPNALHQLAFKNLKSTLIFIAIQTNYECAISL